ncbi:unnamed protein product [Linum tenue]|uniref:Uncharacterized protein n=1 Tax=Linum tenue TaxID=586396 RepID=A0AAV0NCR5_9ROSI|nr:unnamed protein product [Linum tenue]
MCASDDEKLIMIGGRLIERKLTWSGLVWYGLLLMIRPFQLMASAAPPPLPAPAPAQGRKRKAKSLCFSVCSLSDLNSAPGIRASERAEELLYFL